MVIEEKEKCFTDSFADWVRPIISFWIENIYENKKPKVLDQEEKRYYDAMLNYVLKIKDAFSPPYHSSDFLYDISIPETLAEKLKGIIGDVINYYDEEIEKLSKQNKEFLKDEIKSLEKKRDEIKFLGID